ncbi:PREDICTED: uncharacterized protein LOC106743239 [Dinoponera quadriceps]|uniref:Uncharacterized protein LOC106743239 n=1 Tax=Dinoponera quadriceps TaxID=609295 RepID=A0A6P3X2B6_DINQU|nr:PREDICTED: uncharacterized protein LOC106743239 [Dinoponera quadriceps]
MHGWLAAFSKLELADIISKWAKSDLFENLITHPQSDRLEITVIRKSRGIIILDAGDLNVILVNGNSVIALCDSVCSLASYRIMFTATDIPPSVINMLLIEKKSSHVLGIR